MGPLRTWISAATFYPNRGQMFPDLLLIQVEAHAVHKHHCLNLTIYHFFPRSAWPLCQDPGPQGKMVLARDTDTQSFLQLPVFLFFYRATFSSVLGGKKKALLNCSLFFLLTKSRTPVPSPKKCRIGDICLPLH